MSMWFLLIACENEQAAFGIATSTEAKSAVTWYEDVQPIIEQHCVRCHIEDGVAMGDFRNVDDVIALAPLMHVAMSTARSLVQYTKVDPYMQSGSRRCLE